jgi:hypothetical protein
MSQFLIVPIFIVAFSALWSFVSVLLSILSGWMLLSKYYKTTKNDEIQTWKNSTAFISFINYKYCLTFGVDNIGLYLAVFPLFKIGHKKLYIPWTDIETEEKEIIFIKYIIFIIKDTRVKIKIHKNLANEILKYKQ